MASNNDAYKKDNAIAHDNEAALVAEDARIPASPPDEGVQLALSSTKWTGDYPSAHLASETNVSSKTQEEVDHIASMDVREEDLLLETSSNPASSVSNPTLEVDLVYDDIDGDSAISGGSNTSSTDSVRSSVYDFVEEHGRTYHRYKQGKYILPNDLKEQDRLDLQHHLGLLMLNNKLNLAPISNNLHSVLDVGTGTGIWAIDFAIQHPSANVLGTDLSPIQPAFIPPNCRFEIVDAEDEWNFSTKFDFVHMRGMITCFTDHRSILAKAINALAPGGYLEIKDGVFPLQCHDDTLLDTSLDIWAKACVEAGARLGRQWTNTRKYKGWMEELGLEDVREKIFELPTNTWPKGKKAKKLGMLLGADLLDLLEATMALMTRGLGWSPERVESLLVGVRENLQDRAIHAFLPAHVIYGRKPEN